MSKLPIIILHGWGSSGAAWEKPKHLLEKAGFSVFVPDLPGFGKESAPKQPFSVSDYVNFVLGFAKLPKVDKFVLIGHSFGGRVAIKLVAEHPEKVEKLILTGAAGIRFISRWEKIKISLFLPISKLGHVFLNTSPFTILSPVARKILYFLAGARDYYVLQNPIMKETFKKTINEDLEEKLKLIKMPTLLLWGGDDRIIPLSHARKMEKEIPYSELVIIKNARHAFPYNRGEEVFVKEVLKFLEK